MSEFLIPFWVQEAGLWFGIVLSLFLFSTLIRNNWATRLAQHILAGAVVGYVIVLVTRDLLWSQTLRPLLRQPAPDPAAWFAIGLLLLVFAIGLVRTLAGGSALRGAFRWVLLVALVPVALSIGFAAGALAIGVVQGTLAPQFLRAAATGFQFDSGAIGAIGGVIMLVATTGTLIHLRSRSARDFAALPGWIRSFFEGWAGIGKRALWLAAGVIFARLVASRLSILIGQVQWLTDSITSTQLWTWLSNL